MANPLQQLLGNPEALQALMQIGMQQAQGAGGAGPAGGLNPQAAMALINRLTAEESTFDKICAVVARIFLPLGQLVFIAGLAALIITGIALGIGLPATLTFQIPIGLLAAGAGMFAAGQCAKALPDRQVADITYKHSLSF